MRLLSLDYPGQQMLNFSGQKTTPSEVLDLLCQVPLYVPSMELLGQMIEILLAERTLIDDNLFLVGEIDGEIPSDGVAIKIPDGFVKDGAPQVISYLLERAKNSTGHQDDGIYYGILGNSQLINLKKRKPEVDIGKYRIYIGNLQFYELVARKLGVRLVSCDSHKKEAEFFQIINAVMPGDEDYSSKLSQLGIQFPGVVSGDTLRELGIGVNILFPGDKYLSFGSSVGHFEGSGRELGIALFTK